MFMSENQMIVKDALARVDEVLNAEPLSISEHPSHPKDNSVELKMSHTATTAKRRTLGYYA